MPGIVILSFIISFLMLMIIIKMKIDEADKKKEINKQIDEHKEIISSQEKLPSTSRNDSEIAKENEIIYQGPQLDGREINIKQFEISGMFILHKEKYKIGDKIRLMLPSKQSSGDMLYPDEKMIVKVTECYQLQVSRCKRGSSCVRLQSERGGIDIFIPEDISEKYPNDDVIKSAMDIRWFFCYKNTKGVYDQIKKSIEDGESGTWYLIRFDKGRR